MVDTVAILTFWLSAALIAYAYVGYPLLIYILGRLGERPTLRKEIWPRVSLLVPAHNEGHAIKAKIQNCMQLEYPKDRLEVFVASDGSTDATARVIEEATHAGLIRGVVYPERRGKAAVANYLGGLASGGNLVVSGAPSKSRSGGLRGRRTNFAEARGGRV